MSRKSPDILKPCGGYVHPYLGGCWQHYLKSSESQSVWENVTKVVDYSNTDWSSTGISPYLRPLGSRNEICFGARAGGADDCQVQEGNGPGNGNPSEDYPTTCSFLECVSTPSGYLETKKVNQGIYHNCFIKSSASVNMAACKRIGFKSLLASKVWQGRLGYTSRDHPTTSTNFWDGFDWCGNQCGIHNYDPTPDGTKYLALSGEATLTLMSDQGTPYSVTGTAEATCEVDRYSGKTTVSRTSSSVVNSGTYMGNMKTIADNALALLLIGNSDASYLLAAYGSILAQLPVIPNSISGGGNTWTLVWLMGIYTDAQAVVEINMSDFTLTYYHETEYYDNDSEQYVKYTDSTEQMTFTSTTVHDHRTYVNGSPEIGPTAVRTEYTVDCSLSTPYTSEDLMDDWLDLISSHYNIGSETLYPWRYTSGENNRMAPLVTRDEVVGTVALLTDVGGYDWLVDGTVVGNPTNIVNTGFWDGKHKVYQHFEEEDCSGWEHSGYGAWVGGSQGVPNAATKKPTVLELYDDNNGWGVPEGAFLSFNPLTQTLWGAINAQTYIGAKGYNWARPCGTYDRFQLDVANVNCIDSVSGNTVTLNLYGSQTNHMTGNFTCSIWGASEEYNGVWLGTGASGTTVTLARQIVSGSDMPPYPWGYAADTTYGNGMICKNRWFGNTRPFCGHVDITAITKTTPVTISLMEPQQAMVAGDKVWIKGCSGSVELNNTEWTVVPMGTPYTQFALLGSNSESFSQPYTSSGWVECPWAPDWKWNSDASRQNYVIGTYYPASSYRELYEYTRLQAQSNSNAPQGDPPVYNNCIGDGYCSTGTMIEYPTIAQPTYTQHCIPFSACRPNVIAIMPTPNSHSFISASIHTMNTGIPIDSKYGNLWQSWIIQTMPDPLYAGAPPCPCRAHVPCDDEEEEEPLGYDCFSENWGWSEDSLCLGIQEPVCDGMGGLLLRGEDYYASRDIYEAVCEYPSASCPRLPSGLNLTQSYFVPSIGSIYPSLSTLGYQPWYNWMLKENCVCIEGRFKTYYQRNGVECLEEDSPLI